MSLTIEQQRAIAMAKARKRKAEAQEQPKMPVAETVSEPGFDWSFGGISPIVAMAGVGAATESLAGLWGIATSIFKGPEAGAQAVEDIRRLVRLDPEENVANNMRILSDKLKPVTDVFTAAEEGLGEAGYELAGPVGGAVGKSLPTAAMMALGPATRMASKPIKAGANAVKTSRAVSEAAPTLGKLKASARSLYNQVDDLGVTIKQENLKRLSDSMAKTTKAEGFNARIHPKTAAALDEAASLSDEAMSVSELLTLRKVARAAGRSIEPEEARLGGMMVDMIDDFIDDLPSHVQSGVGADKAGALLTEARGYWRRLKSSETIADAVEKAKNQASGFENGIRVQFRAILNNKKKSSGFTADELDAMRSVVRGTNASNLLKHLGKFGFTEGQAGSVLLSSLGVAGGAAFGGAPGAVAIPVIGQAARTAAQKLTARNARLADELIRAGKDGRQIAAAYLKSVPKAERSVEELAGLLLRQEVPLTGYIPAKNPFVSDAILAASIIAAREGVEESEKLAADEPVN